MSRYAARIATILALMLGTGLVHAQDTGEIHGTATPHAQVIVANEASGAIVGVVADDKGNFTAKHLPPGQYQVSQQGHSAHAKGAPVMAGRVTTLDLGGAKSAE
ncbi:MAG: carboxypeptidase-like regulatory domain-containing protein [Luteibacter sp.]